MASEYSLLLLESIRTRMYTCIVRIPSFARLELKRSDAISLFVQRKIEIFLRGLSKCSYRFASHGLYSRDLVFLFFTCFVFFFQAFAFFLIPFDTKLLSYTPFAFPLVPWALAPCSLSHDRIFNSTTLPPLFFIRSLKETREFSRAVQSRKIKLPRSYTRREFLFGEFIFPFFVKLKYLWIPSKYYDEKSSLYDAGKIQHAFRIHWRENLLRKSGLLPVGQFDPAGGNVFLKRRDQ